MLNRREALAAPLAIGFAVSAFKNSSLPTDFAALVRSTMAANRVPGLAIAIVENGKLSHAEGFGVRSVESAEAVDPDTLFRAGSIAKPITALTMLRLVDQGEVRLDGQASKYLPTFRTGKPIRVDQLLSHTAGLGDFSGTPSSERLPTMASYAARPLSLFAEPGRWFSYSNPGFALAGAIIEAVTGNSFEVEAQKTIDGLGLRRTTFDLGRAMTFPHALSHRLDGGIQKVLRPEPLDKYRADTAAGMMFASANDLGRFAEWLISGPGPNGIVSRAAFVQMKTPQGGLAPIQFAYGLGLRLHGLRKQQVIGHGGNIPGNSATVHVVPSRGFGIAIVANADGAAFVEEIMNAAFERFAGMPQLQPIAAAPAADQAGSYQRVGIDGAVRHGEIYFTSIGRIALRGANGAMEDYGTPFRRDVYRKGASYLVFLRDASGQVVGANLGSRHWLKVD